MSASFITANGPQFRELVQQALRHAREAGATDAAAEVSESQGLSVTVRHGEVETVEQTRDRSLDVTVYVGQRRGSASTSDFAPSALADTVRAAWHIASHTAQDPAAGLPDEADLMLDPTPDMQLYHPWDIDAKGAARLAKRAEKAALQTDARIANSDGATVSTY